MNLEQTKSILIERVDGGFLIDFIERTLDAQAARIAELETELLALRHSSAEAYRRGIEDAANVAERMLAYADTTSNADKEIAAAIHALAPSGGGNE